jgi:hypothetical protein
MSRVRRYRGGRIATGWLTIVVVGAGLILALSGRAAGAQSAGTSPALFNRQAYNYSTALTTAQEAQRYRVLVLQSTDGSRVAALHAANPNLKILMYQAVLHSVISDPTGLTTCTPYATDSASHPSWFLTDQAGNRIPDVAYSNSYLMDVGNPSYEQACAAHAAALAKQYGFDGVYMDGLNSDYRWLVSPGVTIPEYPTAPSWQAANLALISYFGPQLRSQGLLAMANIGGSTMTPGLWRQWTAPLDGSEEESWTDGGAGLAQQSPFWSLKLANVAWSEANGKYALLHSYNTTETANTYGLASMMLVAGGYSSYSTTNTTGSETWFPEYATAQQLGAPSTAYIQLANGVYGRQFANGIVLVNPTANAVKTFSLGGGIYSGSGLTRVGAVSMGATSGLILLRVGGTSGTLVPGTASQPTPAPKPKPKPKSKPKRKPAMKVRCIVPKLAHLKLGVAEKAISRAHCRVGRIVRKRSSRHYRRHVLGQSPAPHKRVASETKVNLTIGR